MAESKRWWQLGRATWLAAGLMTLTIGCRQLEQTSERRPFLTVRPIGWPLVPEYDRMPYPLLNGSATAPTWFANLILSLLVVGSTTHVVEQAIYGNRVSRQFGLSTLLRLVTMAAILAAIARLDGTRFEYDNVAFDCDFFVSGWMWPGRLIIGFGLGCTVWSMMDAVMWSFLTRASPMRK